MKQSAALFLLCLLLPAPVSAANDSVYTDLDLDACKTLSEDEETGSVSLQCKGLDNYPVYFAEGDLRQGVLFGPASKAYIDGTFESFGPFNYIAEKVEWRKDPKGKPVAAILRWFISNPNPDTGTPDDSSRGQVLVVSRVAQPADGIGCVAGYVDALDNKDANALARTIADTIAPDFQCGKEKAVFLGKTGDKTGDPTSSFPEP